MRMRLNMKKKKLKIINLILIGTTIAGVGAAGFIYAKTLNSHFELEHSLRLENLAVVALNNGNKILACKALSEAKNALDEADFHAKDLSGMVHGSATEVCEQVRPK